MYLTELAYKPKLGGWAHGTMMLHVTEGPSGSSSSNWDIMDIVERCENAANMMNLQARVVLVRPLVDSDVEETTKFLMMLKDRGFNTGLILENTSVPIYIREAGFVQAVLHEPTWDNYRVNELIYQPNDDLVEPEIKQNNAACGKYIFMPKRSTPKDYITFIRTAKFMWGLVVPPSKEVSVDFLKEKK